MTQRNIFYETDFFTTYGEAQAAALEAARRFDQEVVWWLAPEGWAVELPKEALEEPFEEGVYDAELDAYVMTAPPDEDFSVPEPFEYDEDGPKPLLSGHLTF